ncbi:thermonuclease family protein [Breoghania sp. L-A4]|uniref:thermonuclease family protein n=1 Tax=Breoghania sp. L-A4 TaxID=2304600 RepID=UPI000E358187|nr:thermonuclease family protein [Breoghania sp. L-A4]AXS39636.1 thermonuclease family protein [Breoghania sp. L-A4]
MPRAGKAVVFGALVLAAGAALLLARAPETPAPQQNTPEEPKASAIGQPASLDLTPQTAGFGETVSPARRDVTPESMTKGPTVTGPLVRIEDAKPERPKRPPPPKTMRLHPVVVVDGGTLRHDQMTVQLAGVRPLALDARCGGGDGWPCGRLARTALRRLIRGRSVSCEREDGTAMTGALVTARCRIIRRDISDWLIEQGWATPADDANDAAARLLAAAREAGRGQWRVKQLAAEETTPLPDPAQTTLEGVDLDVPEIEGSPFDFGGIEPATERPVVQLPIPGLPPSQWGVPDPIETRPGSLRPGGLNPAGSVQPGAALPTLRLPQ